MIISADRCKSNLCYTATGAAVKLVESGLDDAQ
jgi:hypothetical protein